MDDQSSYGDIHVMNSDGSGVRRLTNVENVSAPAWSPDGSGQRRLAARAAYSDSSPAWSPDGSMVVFVSRELSAGATAKSALWLMSAAGSRQRQLTAANFDDYAPS